MKSTVRILSQALLSTLILFLVVSVNPNPDKVQAQTPIVTATTLLLDTSGSMDDRWQGGIKIESAKEAAIKVINIMEQDSYLPGATGADQIAVATFSNNAGLPFSLSADYAQARSVISGLRATGGTNMGAGLQIAHESLLSAPPNSRKIIILLSDGNTNEGLSPDQILDGPVQEALAAGTCIFTIGFGDRGDLNEPLLHEIAQRSLQQTHCGDYYYADVAQLEQGLLTLENAFIQDRHASIRDIITQFGGDIHQGETTLPQTFEVLPHQDLLVGTINWPGNANVDSKLDLLLTDPDGNRVDNNKPGVQIAISQGLYYIAVEDPKPGTWQVSVFGANVPEGVTPYNVIFSTQAGTPPAQPQPVTGSGSGGLIFVLFIIILLVTAGAAIFMARRGRRATVEVGVRLLTGQAAPTWAIFRQEQLRLGRGHDNTIILADKDASRHHARIIKIPQGYLLEDLGSTNGTYVNGEKTKRQMLRDGDVLQIGRTQFRFEIHQ